MKLGSIEGASRDGSLIVVSRDLSAYVSAESVAPSLQAALENWRDAAPRLGALYEALNAGGAANARPFDQKKALSPLPRAYQFVDGSSYLSHAELVRRARGAKLPEDAKTNALMYQAQSDRFYAPHGPIPVLDDNWGVDLEGEVAVIVDDVAMGVTAAEAKKHIKLVMLVNDVSYRNIIPKELEKGFGFLQGKGSTAFSPVAVTPDELGASWDGSKTLLPLLTSVNGETLGAPDSGKDMYFDFPALIAHAARTRELSAGTIVGSGTISNHGAPHGYSCLSEKRMMETVAEGKPTTSFMKFGDRVRIEMLDTHGASIFGAIDQQVTRYQPS